jgi:hypothetical protein
MLLVYSHLTIMRALFLIDMGVIYLLSSLFQLSGRFIPGWGQAGQKIARPPGCSSVVAS